MDHVRLEDLLNRHVDGALTGEDRREFERMLLDSPDARGVFWRFARLNSLIRDNFQSQAGQCVAADAVPPIIVTSDVGPSGGAWQSALGWLSQTEPLSCMIATVIVGLMLLGFWAIKITHYQHIAEAPSKSVPSIERPEFVFVGRITGLLDVKWSDDKDFLPPHGYADVPLDHKYKLDSGLMEITYDSGAKVIL
ncbi:MAG: hypothetical protein L6306_14240, partial [Planctomycetales bacterium]|nr:hypothetical protein [Planctomycetales bacterium]